MVLFDLTGLKTLSFLMVMSVVLQVGNWAARVAFSQFLDLKAIITKTEFCYITVLTYILYLEHSCHSLVLRCCVNNTLLPS